MFERCAGLDVHKKTVTACVRVPGDRWDRVQHVRTFGSRSGLREAHQRICELEEPLGKEQV